MFISFIYVHYYVLYNCITVKQFITFFCFFYKKIKFFLGPFLDLHKRD